MNKPISRDIHILIDYSYAAIVPLLPELAGFSKLRMAKTACRLLGAGALGYTLLTKAPYTALRVLPFRAHLVIDAAVSLLALATPWLLGFSRNSAARNTLVTVGLAGLSVNLLTDLAKKADSAQETLFI
ncbi:hypothetical protein GCM10023313_20510 [Mucilaginibacter defluvii]|uniref:Uncharacterized protein n=1 Tax=Mucilaginibacter defluvii TaxID=1196019 RepID=A0ABP9G0E6_9SPHI